MLIMPFEGVSKTPDPNLIQLAGEWYLLNHISSPLVRFDHDLGKYVPLIAEKWSLDGTNFTFHISQEAKFNDGQPILASDVAATIKKLIVSRTLTHFPLWEYLEGCHQLTSINEDCSGIKVVDSHTIKFKLTEKRESFFLALSSPETAIWSVDDITDTKLEPKRFSGPYFVEKEDISGLTLAINKYSILIAENPSAPRKIYSPTMSRAEIEDGIVEGKVDLFIGDYIPYNKYDWEQQSKVKARFTTPSSVVFLAKNSHQTRSKRLGRDFLKAVWEKLANSQVLPAKSFLPPGSLGVTKPEEILEAIGEANSDTIKIAAPAFYFMPGLVDKIKKIGNDLKLKISIDLVSKEQWLNLMTGKDKGGNWDYTLSTYVASERYPAVQLYFMLYDKKAPSDLFKIDDIETDKDRSVEVRNFEKWMVKQHYVIPMFFVRTHIVHRENIELGNQPLTDADIHLWKVTKSD